MELWNDDLERLHRALPELIVEAERKLPYVSISFTVDHGLAVSLEDDRPMISLPQSETGITMTLFDGVAMHEFGMNQLDLDLVARKLRQRVAEITVQQPRFELYRNPCCHASFRFPIAQDPLEVTLPQKLADLQYGRTLALQEPLIKHTRFYYNESRIIKVFVASSRNLKQELSLVSLNFLLFASDGGQTQYSRDGNTSVGGYELVRRRLTPDKIHAAAEKARALLKAERVPPGTHALLTAPMVSGLIAHEAFGHGVEIDMFLKRCARARMLLGQPVAAPMINMFDSPQEHNSSGFYYFDDEGEIAHPVQIIRDGIFVSGISDLYAASRLQLPKTPHGRRESFRRKVYSRMANTYIAPGNSPFETMLAELDNGIYLSDGDSGMEDPLGWGIQININAGEEIRNGVRTGKIFAPIVLTGYVPDLLKSITQVGSDFATVGLGHCGKTFRKDWITVGSGSPALLMEGRLA